MLGLSGFTPRQSPAAERAEYHEQRGDSESENELNPDQTDEILCRCDSGGIELWRREREELRILEIAPEVPRWKNRCEREEQCPGYQ
jgi:hypothetical protein